MAYTKMPNLSVYERDTLNNILPNFFTPGGTLQGNAKEKYNPVAFATLGEHKRYQDNTSTGFNLRYSILNNLLGQVLPLPPQKPDKSCDYRYLYF